MIPFSGPFHALFTASLTCSAVACLESSTVRSTTDTLDVGTRIAIPSSLPLSSGITSATAFAAPGVGEVEYLLVVGVRVDRGHQPPLDPEGVEEHLRDRREAVRRAGGVGDDPVLRGVICLLVHPHHEGGVGVLGRGRDED